MPSFSQLEIFSLVAELNGFTAAGIRLGISQSAVSHAIKALEQEFKVEVLRRRASGVELTPIGRQLLGRAREILGLAEAMRQEAADARGLRFGTLRIGSFGPTASVRLLPRILADYQRLYPGIEVHVDEGPDRQVLDWLRDRRIDIGFCVLPEEDFTTYPLVEDQMVALVPAAHPLAARSSLALRDLCADPFILTEAGSGELVTRLFQAAKLTPRIRYRSGQLLSTLETVARGDGVSIVAELSLPAPPPAPLYLSKPLEPRVKRRVGLAVLNEHSLPPAGAAFIKLAGRLGQAGAWIR